MDDLLSDPDKVVDIIVAAKDAIGQIDVSDEEISNAIDVAASGLGIPLTDSEKSTLVQLYNKFKNMNLDENELRARSQRYMISSKVLELRKMMSRALSENSSTLQKACLTK